MRSAAATIEPRVYTRYALERAGRRVIAVHNGIVCYSVGGDRNRYCQLRTFRRWLRGKPRSAPPAETHAGG